MYNPLTPLALYIRDLLSYDESLIKAGRDNWKQENEVQNLIVLDLLSARSISKTRLYDPDSEIQSSAIQYRADVTVDFYGDDAQLNCDALLIGIDTEAGSTLQRTHSVTVYKPESITNVRQLTGTQYGPKLQMALQIGYNATSTASVNKITTPVTSVITN